MTFCWCWTPPLARMASPRPANSPPASASPASSSPSSMARLRAASSWPFRANWACPFVSSARASNSTTSSRSTHKPTPTRYLTKTVNAHDIHFMQHALDLARKGVGLASPNPTVGCVIAKDGAILGEGFHQYHWRDHAEIVALKQAGDRARGATL